MKKLIYQGLIKEDEYGDNYNATYIGDTVIADELSHEIFDKTVTVRYWISDTPKTKQELVMNQVLTMSGALDADYSDAYSDITGYLWTDEKLNVGGHDLLSEITSHEGKYIYLEIDIH